MALREEVQALRTTTALCEASPVVVLRVSGSAAFATLDRVCPVALALQDTQMQATVLLREDGVVFADAYVARDDEGYFLLSEGPGADELEAWVRTHAAFPDLQVARFDQSHQVLSLHGPWAWDLLAACVGADVLGMPFLSFLRCEGGVLCFRAGKTGEYGYELLVPRGEVERLRAALLQHGTKWELARVSLEALDHCALENWFFNIRKEGTAGLSPLELGLQWRLGVEKDFVGAAALKERRARGVQARLTCVLVEGPVAVGDAVMHEGQKVGTVLNAVESFTLGRWVAAALLDLPLAVPGIRDFSVSGKAARTVTPPVLNNRSLYVSPQRHTWAERNSSDFPPLTLGAG